MKGAIFHGAREPLTVEEVEIDRPLSDEVLVRVVASGVCHSDAHYVDGLYELAVPSILGHEAAGIVEAVGAGVDEFRPGDHVIACPSAFCGRCEYCLTGRTHLCPNRPARAADAPSRLCWRGAPVGQFLNIAGFAEQILVHPNGLAKVRDDMPLDSAALIGCGVTTGVGAALKTARVEPGSSVAVFGAGGVGLAAIQGARIAGARTIVAVDIHAHKLRTARELGATHAVDASSTDPVEHIVALTDGGVDYAFEAVGLKAAAEQAWECLRPGGTATVIGMIPTGQKVEIDGSSFLTEKKIQGSMMGSNHFKVDMPKYVDFYMQGRLRLDEMITRRIGLGDIDDAFRSMKAGEVSRSVIVF
jgi:S-(hydroxymethyl)glutathione dehydrogenase/alcohol dehydrogenase